MTFKASKVQKQNRIKIYNTLALPTILYRIESWALKMDNKRIIAAEMKFMSLTQSTLG